LLFDVDVDPDVDVELVGDGLAVCGVTGGVADAGAERIAGVFACFRGGAGVARDAGSVELGTAGAGVMCAGLALLS
jgi:hypothetical protein